MGYINVDAVRAAGLPEEEANDQQVQEAIDLWSSFVDRQTRQWFERRSRTIYVDGNGTNTLFLPVPIISISAIYMNDNFTTAMPLDMFAIYNRRDVYDDRQNPKISIVSQGQNIFMRHRHGGAFARGSKNQKLVGAFGYVEADGMAPPLIQRAVLRLVLLNSPQLYGSRTLSYSAGAVTSESTDGHSISYAQPTRIGSSGITRDGEVEAILSMYRAPIAIAMTGGAAPNWWELG